jgi:hypothetical protein
VASSRMSLSRTASFSRQVRRSSRTASSAASPTRSANCPKSTGREPTSLSLMSAQATRAALTLSLIARPPVERPEEGAELGDRAGERVPLVQHHPATSGWRVAPAAGRVAGGDEVDVAAVAVHRRAARVTDVAGEDNGGFGVPARGVVVDPDSHRVAGAGFGWGVALLGTAQVKLGRRDARLLIDLRTVMLNHIRVYVPDDLTNDVDRRLGLQLGQISAENQAARNAEAEESDDLDRIPSPPPMHVGSSR